ncbi:DUF6612 family protein [Thermosediminibacter oceani]|uniref:Lipoprotein n=1 Tax=Thermosediminibacter oceani (strain ATCC BAA-1034 / DSM 16646 / JW/IW-1228P) TaxID=555079 RepID=D9S3F3_THEOJ|nr:hypothetical protein Toce_1172 [Thermosediminibacter oceani DSM 16646]
MIYSSLKSAKYFAVYVIATLIISMVLAGCGDRFKDLSPKEAVIKANEKLKNVSGYRMNVDAELMIKDIKQQLTLTGEVRNPDQVHLAGDLAGMEIEIYQKKDKFFIKNPLTGKWVETKEMGLGDMNEIISTPEKTLNDLKDMISEAEYLPDEKVNGIDCKVIEYIPDQEKLKKIVFEGTEPGSIKKAKYRIWIGKNDFLIYKMNIDIKYDAAKTGEQSINMTVLLYDFNNDININYPKELAS